MKSIYKIFCVALLMMSSLTAMQAQICVNATLTLTPDGTAVLSAEQIINFELQPDQSVFVLPAYFTCEDVPEPTPVTVYLIDSGDTVYLCTQDVIVVDSTPPVAVCKNNIHVQLGENGGYRLSFDEINDDSYDLCTEVVSHKFFPEIIRCTDPNPVDVMMVVRDLSGNQDTCTVAVSYDDYTGPTDPIECRDSLPFYLYQYDDEPILITPDKILLPGVHGCSENYSIDIYDGAVLRPDDYISVDDSLALLSAILKELGSGEQCTTDIIIYIALDPCDFFMAPMCDTLCHSAPLGDCASGHTAADPIELPCDVFITNWCGLSDFYPDPEFIEWYGYPSSQNAWPAFGPDFITDENNQGPYFVGFWDEIIELQAGQQIIRHWTILNWCTQQTLEYAQNIFVTFDLTDICDTLPWNVPVGDCQSGHTLSDDVEWPADITIHSVFSHPEDLAQNPEVQFENIQPRVNNDCVVNDMTYNDVITEINDTTLRVERTWEIVDAYSQAQWQYVQVITIIHEAFGSVVCVSTEQGDPIPGVELIPGVITDDSGCHEFLDPGGIIVTPVKDSPLEECVNVLDAIMLLEHLLGVRQLSIFQQYAADVNSSQGLSTVDFVVVRKILQGIFTPVWSHHWRFFEQNTLAGSIDISDPMVPYKFIGVKFGDLDNSCITGLNLDDIVLRTEDDVLNAGETYSVPFYLERNESLAGIGLRLKNENQNLEFLNVTAPNLPFFEAEMNVVTKDDGVVIFWISPAPTLIDGVAVDSTEPLFIVDIRADENIILNEHLTLEATYDNVLKPAGDNDPLRIRLSWEDVIVNSVVDLGNGRVIEFYPNPADDVLSLKGIDGDEEGKVIIMDATGRIAFEGDMIAALDLSQLHTGMYYIMFEVEGVKSVAVPMVKM